MVALLGVLPLNVKSLFHCLVNPLGGNTFPVTINIAWH